LAASPFHVGEQQVQERLGVRGIEAWARTVVRPYLPEEHRTFHTALPFLVAGARDGRGRPWATLLVGPEGFVRSPDPKTLAIAARPVRGDALEGALVAGADLGLLGIELATRRRNRVNGRIEAADEGLLFRVGQSFGNCPQYIHEREWRRAPASGAPPRRSAGLTADQRAWISSADTFFIASGHRGEGESEAFGMDVSHRGGDPGFVRVEGARRLWFPDYTGNNHFNTLGNLVLDPRAGLLFVDFATGGLLQLTGRAGVTWEGPEVDAVPGARRLVHVDVEEVVELPGALPLRFGEPEAAVRSLRLVEKLRESEDVTSFVLESRDGGPLAPFEAGQHLPIELEIPGRAEPLRRTYSLSGAPGAGRYRISVKREARGLASRHLHDQVEPGGILSARRPAGDFLLGCTQCPVALVSAGIGLTPLLAMLHALAGRGDGRPVWWLHGARDGAHHPLAAEVRALVGAHANFSSHVVYSRPRPQDLPGRDFDGTGRLDAARVLARVPERDAHFHLCGPTGFMAALQQGLEAAGIPPAQIHSESFGPAA